jgi:adenylate kinase family enzyme
MTFYPNHLSNYVFEKSSRWIFFFLVLLLGQFPVAAQDLEQDLLVELRQNLSKAFNDEAVSDRLFSKVKDQNFTSPELMAYVGGIWISQSRHVFLFDKMHHFNKGTEILDAAIRAKPDDVEMRFLRMTIQINAPGFLRYGDNLEEDKRFVLKNYKSAPKVMQQKIIDFVKKSDAFSAEEKNL